MSFEKMRVYGAAVQLRAEVDRLGASLNQDFAELFRHVNDAVDSVLNNIAEGAESIYPGKQRYFFDVAAGSAREVRSGLTSLGKRGAFRNGSPFRAIGLTLVICKMLAAIIECLKD